MRTDCFAHRCAQTSVRILTAAHRRLCASVRVCARVCASVRICARLCASVRIHTILFCAHLCAFGAHAHHHYMLCAVRTAIAHSHSMLCAFCAHSVRMLTDVGAHAHRNQLCAFGAHCAPTSVEVLPPVCAQRTDCAQMRTACPPSALELLVIHDHKKHSSKVVHI